MGIKEAWDTIVLDEYRKRNIGLVEDYRISKPHATMGIFYQSILIIFAAILYLLYKLQLPYEMIIWTLVTFICMYFLNKYIIYAELNILGKSDNPIASDTDRWKQSFSLPPIHLHNNEFIKFIKHIKIASYFLGFTVITVSLLIFFIRGTLNGFELWLFLLGLILFVSQMIHMSIKALDGIDERYIKIGKEIQELANEMEKEGLITRDDKYDEYGEDRLFQLLAKKI